LLSAYNVEKLFHKAVLDVHIVKHVNEARKKSRAEFSCRFLRWKSSLFILHNDKKKKIIDYGKKNYIVSSACLRREHKYWSQFMGDSHRKLERSHLCTTVLAIFRTK
jgi:hypothetical protein